MEGGSLLFRWKWVSSSPLLTLANSWAFPSTKRTPEITSASRSDPVILRQDFSASSPSRNIIAIAVARLPIE